MTFLELQQQASQALGYGSVATGDALTRFKSWINEGNRKLMRIAGLSDLRRFAFTFASVSGTKVYAMAKSMEQIDSIENQSQYAKLGYMTHDEFRAADPAEIITGQPTRWVPKGVSPVYLQPSNTGLWAASTSAADTAISVIIQGITIAGITQSQVTTTLTGTSRVALGSVTTYGTVVGFTLSAAAVGAVTLYDAATLGNALGTILIGDVSAQYQLIRLWPTPTQADTYAVDGQVNVATLTSNTDIPVLPELWHDLLIEYCRIREYERVNKAGFSFQFALGDWIKDAKAMRARISFPPDYRAIAGLSTPSKMTGWNGLTGWFPADGGD